MHAYMHYAPCIYAFIHCVAKRSSQNMREQQEEQISLWNLAPNFTLSFGKEWLQNIISKHASLFLLSFRSCQKSNIFQNITIMTFQLIQNFKALNNHQWFQLIDFSRTRTRPVKTSIVFHNRYSFGDINMKITASEPTL